MVKIGLQIQANFENVKELKVCGDEFRWALKFRCTNCSEESRTWQYVTLTESSETKGGRGTASMVQKCKLCSRENTLDIFKDSIKSYTEADEPRFHCIVAFDCRGMEPIEFDFGDDWVVLCNSITIFDNVDLSEGEWYDYDEVDQETVSVTNLAYNFIKLEK